MSRITGEPSIETLLTIGENIVIEFKRAGDGPKHDTYESICAFLNRNGGDVLLGVTDDGEVVGVPPKSARDMVRSIVKVMNDPNLWEPRIAVYHEIGRADELGSGVRNLYHYVKLYSGVEPIFDESDVFRLTIPLNDDYSPEKGTTDKTTEKTTEKATEKNAGQGTETVESRIRKLVCDNPTISMKEMAQILGMTNDGVYYHIKGLRNAGKLRRVGGRKIGHWEFKD